jgi:hypothetical protein
MTGAAHAVWTQGLDWLVPPARVGLFVFLAVMLLLKGVPFLLRQAGRAVEVGATPVMGLLAYPEYLATSLARARGWRLMPGTFAYGRLLGVLATGMGRIGSALRSLGRRRPPVPWKTLVLVVGVLIAAWYTKIEAVPEQLRPSVTSIKGHVAQVDTWFATGRWPASTTANGCLTPAKVSPKRPRR